MKHSDLFLLNEWHCNGDGSAGGGPKVSLLKVLSALDLKCSSVLWVRFGEFPIWQLACAKCELGHIRSKRFAYQVVNLEKKHLRSKRNSLESP